MHSTGDRIRPDPKLSAVVKDRRVIVTAQAYAKGVEISSPDDDLILSEESLDLHPGDRLLLYTDGLTDVINEDGDFLGLERLESWSATVTRAFDEFIAEHNGMTSLQIRFLQTLKTFIPEDKLFEEKRKEEEKYYPFVPICRGVRT